MEIQVVVKPNSRRTGVEEVEPGIYRVSVNAPPQEGKANAAVIEALANHFGVPKSRVTILHGQKGRKKRVEIREVS